MTRTLAGKIIGRHETARVGGGSLAVLLLENVWRERGVALRGGFGAGHRLPEDEQRGEESGPVHELHGNIITVGAERFRCAEVFFSTQIPLVQKPAGSMRLLSIMWRDVDIRKIFVRQCLAVTWTAMFQWTGKRLFEELTTSAPSSMKIKVVAPPERLYSECFPQLMWTSKGEYGDSGPRVSTICSVSFFRVRTTLTLYFVFFSLVTLHCQPSTCCRTKKIQRLDPSSDISVHLVEKTNEDSQTGI